MTRQYWYVSGRLVIFLRLIFCGRYQTLLEIDEEHLPL